MKNRNGAFFYLDCPYITWMHEQLTSIPLEETMAIPPCTFRTLSDISAGSMLFDFIPPPDCLFALGYGVVFKKPVSYAKN